MFCKNGVGAQAANTFQKLETTNFYHTLRQNARKKFNVWSRRKIFVERYVCDANDEKFYELLTRNYIGNDEVTDLNGYVDYRFVAIEPAWDGD